MREKSGTNGAGRVYFIRHIILTMLVAILATGTAALVCADEISADPVQQETDTNPQAVTGPQLDGSGHLQYLKDGAVDTSFNGFVRHEGIWYYLKDGTSAHNIRGFVKNQRNNRWFFVQDGKVNWKFTGIAKSTKDGKWYFARNGELDGTFTGIAKSVANGKWYFARKGRLDWNFTGIAKSVANGKWYFCRRGMLDWSFTGVAKSVANGRWYFCRGGKLDWNFTGVAKSVANGKWYFCRKGKLDWNFTGVAKSVANGRWYFCHKGMLDWGYTGLAKSVANGKWYYVRKGELDWNYTGTAKRNGRTYNVNKGRVTGEVRAQKKSEPSASGGNKVVYLTFDDGPGPHTDRLLSILAKYDAKATFFVTGQFPKYSGCIKRAAAAGHAIGAHTMTHDFRKIYSSDSAFWSDQDNVQNLIKKQTGSRTKLLRFAGGSSNTISRKYNRGIMSRLAKQCGQKGVVYFDWNVLSGDAGETTSSSVVAQNVINGIKKQKQPVVLCHDIKGFTVSAMEQVLAWGKKSGCTFRALTTSSPAPHHSILN